MKFSPALQRYIEPLAMESQRRGIPIYAVGGSVRDCLLGVSSKDLDLVMESDPEPLARFCQKKWRAQVEIFDRFGTIRVSAADGFRIDFVRARAESYPQPAVLPVVRKGTLLDDLARRDFTINAMAMALKTGEWGKLIDPHGGSEDLKRKTVRVLHDRSFRDDPTRIFRAARYTCRFDFKLDAKTDALRRSAVADGACRTLSRERLRTELVRILEEENPVCALTRLKSWKLASLLHAQFSWPQGIAAGREAWERLGLIALHMGGLLGRDLIKSLNLERNISHSLLESLEVQETKASPRIPLSPLARRVLEITFRSLPAAALEQLLVNGEDLQKLGLKSGPAFKALLEHAARAQWAGKFSTRAQALNWLRRTEGPTEV